MISVPIKELLKDLPKEIQDRIYMFNCEHKPQMKIVLKELMLVWFPKTIEEYFIGQNIKSLLLTPQEIDAFCYDLCFDDSSIYRCILLSFALTNFE